jgi:catechol 2,3-dioxygenase-like lactoylglutathione lyase family enzyme
LNWLGGLWFCYCGSMEQQHAAVAILPAHDLDESQAFFERLGFAVASRYDAQGYRILRDPAGASVHLTKVDPGWVDAERNAHGIFFYSKDVDALAEEFGRTADPKPWGLREFAVSDPAGTLVRVGWPG